MISQQSINHDVNVSLPCVNVAEPSGFDKKLCSHAILRRLHESSVMVSASILLQFCEKAAGKSNKAAKFDSRAKNPRGGTPLNNPLIDFCPLLSKSMLHF